MRPAESVPTDVSGFKLTKHGRQQAHKRRNDFSVDGERPDCVVTDGTDAAEATARILVGSDQQTIIVPELQAPNPNSQESVDDIERRWHQAECLVSTMYQTDVHFCDNWAIRAAFQMHKRIPTGVNWVLVVAHVPIVQLVAEDAWLRCADQTFPGPRFSTQHFEIDPCEGFTVAKYGLNFHRSLSIPQ